PGLAYRMFGNEHGTLGGFDRYPWRRPRFDVPPPRERTGPIGIVHRKAVLTLLAAQWLDAIGGGRREGWRRARPAWRRWPLAGRTGGQQAGRLQGGRFGQGAVCQISAGDRSIFPPLDALPEPDRLQRRADRSKGGESRPLLSTVRGVLTDHGDRFL